MSALHDMLTEYLAIRRALGTKLREPGGTLRQFVDLLERERAEFITSEIAVRWATQNPDAQPASSARRLGHVRGFAAFLSATDSRTEIPPCHLLSARRRRRPPHIFSAHELARLMAQAARLSSRTGLRALTYTTLIGLLASTGLRPGEAIALDMKDVDLVGGVLSVRDTKFGKSRFVPIDPSTRDALVSYARRSRRLRPSREGQAFLVSENGSRLTSSLARGMFARLSRAVGLRAKTGTLRIGRGPRLQDLRHTFATRRLVEWYRAGADVARKMPGLSTYLGHVAVHHTYWYIEAVPELLQLATNRLKAKGGAK